MSGIGVILNPHSRANKKKPDRILQFGFIVGDKGSCHATETLAQVSELAREFKERDIEILGISGGDGTLHQTLTAFMDVYGEKPLPKIAVLRGGTMNNLATQLGIKGSSEKILSDLIMKYHSNEAFGEKKINLVCINGRHGFLFGMGLIDRFIRKYQSVPEPTPMRGFSLLVHASISSLLAGRFSQHLTRRFNARIYVDGRLMPFKNYMMIFSGTMETLGFRFRPLYRATTVNGKFQFVGISCTGRQLVLTFPSALMAKPSGSPHYIDEMAGKVVLEFDEPMHYNIDGDVIEEPAERIEITAGPLVTFLL